MSILISGNPQFLQSAIRACLHNTMEVKTVLNLEADARDLCQDTVTYTQKVSDYDYQEILDTVFTEMVEE